MRRLPLPTTNDQAVLQQFIVLGWNAALSIGPLGPSVGLRYTQYSASQGNPWAIPNDKSFDTAREAFHSTYKDARGPFEFINDLRAWNGGACPVCGGAGTGTLDHYLPKGVFPEFSFFSPNLVPACYRCNNKRNSRYRGVGPDERPIHPYYDPLPNNVPVLGLEIQAPFEAPGFRAVALNVPPLLTDAVRWHIQNVVVPAGFLAHCEQRWSALVKDPGLFLGVATDIPSARQEFVRRAREAVQLDASQNSWDRCFFDGIANSDAALTYILAQPR